jgi:hypothetical protein
MTFATPHLAAIASAASLVLLSACGGGGDNAGTQTGGSNLSGTVAVGAALTGASIQIKDANGTIREVTADSAGQYTITGAETLTAPFIIKALGTAGGTTYELFSASTGISGGNNILNITPATTAVLTQVLGANPSLAFSADRIAPIDANELQLAKTRLAAALDNVFAALGQPAAQKDLFSTRFNADNTGLDKLLDLIEFSADHQGMLTIQNKSNGQYVSIDKNAASNPQALAAPAEEVVALNTAGITNLIAEINQRLRAGQNSYQQLQDLIDPSFLLGGANAPAFFGDEWEEDTANLQLSSYVIQRCDTAGVCGGHLTATMGGSSTEQLYMMFKHTNGQWRLYGNQKPVDYDLSPMVLSSNLVGPDGVQTTVTSGVYFQVDKERFGSSTITGASLELSQDGGTTWQEQVNLVSRNTCFNSLVLSTSNGCENLLPLQATDIVALENASQQGLLRARVKLFGPNNTLLNTSNVFENMRFATTAQATLNANALGVNVNTAQLGGQQVAFTMPAGAGNPSVDIVSGYSVNDIRYSNSISWDYDEIAALNGLITMAKARSQCYAWFGASAANCDRNYSDTASINTVGIDIRQRQTNYRLEYIKPAP